MKSCVDMKVGGELPKTLFTKEQRHKGGPSVTTEGITSSGYICARTQLPHVNHAEVLGNLL